MRAIGFRVKSGFAIAVVVDGPAGSPTAVARHVVELCDPEVKETKQPYHSARGEAEEDQKKIAKRTALIEKAAAQSIKALLAASPGATRASLVVGSVIDPAKVGNQHIRAHANEGRLFRTVLERALAARGVACSVVVDKHLAEAARKRLRRTDAEIRKTLASFGATVGTPWRGEEKAAATAAWMAL
jgi:hypothetical protein